MYRSYEVKNKNLMDSEVIVKSVNFLSLDNYHVASTTVCTYLQK